MIQGPLSLNVTIESWPIAGTFTIARGSKTDADVVTVTLSAKGKTGRGECVPYRRYGETVEGVIAAIKSARPMIEAGIDRQALMAHMKPGAARNAIDAALIDLECKILNIRAWDLLGLPEPTPKPTCFTISLDTPDKMAAAAHAATARPLLKLKLGRGLDDLARVAAVRDAAPKARLVVDANEGWTIDQLQQLAPGLHDLGVELIEQPLPASDDAALVDYHGPVPLCADESAHGVDGLDAVARLYKGINLKLDKTGGLTPALEVAKAAHARGLSIMLGCMVGTSLAMAPACLLMDLASYVDLDGPLLLAKDRVPPLAYDDSYVLAPPAELWG